MANLGGPHFFHGEGFAPLLAFDTDDAEFARGFEAGRLWTLLREAPGDEFEANLSVENAEMVLRIADATGRHVRSDELGDGWLCVRFTAASS